MKFDTLAVHCAPVDDATGALAPPLHLATTYARDASYALRGTYTYIREANPTQLLAEAALARLEGGPRALTFVSHELVPHQRLQGPCLRSPPPPPRPRWLLADSR